MCEVCSYQVVENLLEFQHVTKEFQLFHQGILADDEKCIGGTQKWYIHLDCRHLTDTGL